MWIKRFIEKQGFTKTSNILYQDTKSTLQVEKNAKESSGKPNWRVNIKYFYITDLIKQKDIKEKFC